MGWGADEALYLVGLQASEVDRGDLICRRLSSARRGSGGYNEGHETYGDRMIIAA